MGHLRSFVATAALAASLLAAAPVVAGETTMAGGSVHFSTPDTWTDILQTDGDPEVRVYQVPDPSPTGHTVLARITVTVKQEPDINGFRSFMEQAGAKARQLPGYKAGAAGAPDDVRYSAREAGVDSSYSERYWYKNGHAIQLRCVRPAHSQAGASWTAAFDKGCDALAAQLR